MIDHMSLPVADLARSRAFYAAALKPLGISLVMEVTAAETGDKAHLGFGTGKPVLWLTDGSTPASGVHVALTADNRAAVDAFHAAALGAGGRDNGAPGLRPYYHPNYYAAFVYDPDGNNIEAVCHTPH
ncbi:VOC family protein [Mangrovicella endophytica]|uniref:VOC family protein n=1 Tax=Mangrovicella endophytica TaxID=2066697 RepID=UPI000C9DF974|nr:VOC family protein [Mangrovicella endophytica]